MGDIIRKGGLANIILTERIKERRRETVINLPKKFVRNGQHGLAKKKQ